MKHTETQYEKLCSLLNELKETNTYYHSILSDFPDKITMENVKQVYEKIKPISRDMILANYAECLDSAFSDGFQDKEEMLSEIFSLQELTDNHDKTITVNEKEWFVECTSGTSGKPFPVVKSKKEKLLEAVYMNRCRKGICADATLDNGLLLVHKNDEYVKSIQYKDNMEEFGKILAYMEEKQPVWMFTTTYVLNRMMQYIASHNITNGYQGLKFIETTSQKLLEDEREQVETFFGCPVISNYGCREVWNIGYECSNHKFHINQDTLVVDLVDEEGNMITEEGKTGDVVITSLVHRTLPIVKYYVGDRAKITYEECGCGKKTPVILLQDGRDCEKLKGTPYFGTTIFRKVLRTLYFKNVTTDISRIRVVQVNEDLLHVFVDKEQKNDRKFEEHFTEYFYQRIKNCKQFTIQFFYEYPFEDGNLLYKQKIFQS